MGDLTICSYCSTLLLVFCEGLVMRPALAADLAGMDAEARASLALHLQVVIRVQARLRN